MLNNASTHEEFYPTRVSVDKGVSKYIFTGEPLYLVLLEPYERGTQSKNETEP